MDFIKDNLNIIIIAAVIILLLIIVIILLKKKNKSTQVIQTQTNNKQIVLEPKTVSIFEAINKETEMKKNTNNIKYVNDFQVNQVKQNTNTTQNNAQSNVVSNNVSQNKNNSSVLTPPTLNNNPNDVLTPPTGK